MHVVDPNTVRMRRGSGASSWIQSEEAGGFKKLSSVNHELMGILLFECSAGGQARRSQFFLVIIFGEPIPVRASVKVSTWGFEAEFSD
jgi:hypothetical protein